MQGENGALKERSKATGSVVAEDRKTRLIKDGKGEGEVVSMSQFRKQNTYIMDCKRTEENRMR